MPSSRVDAKKHINSFRAARGLRDDDVIDPDNPNLADLSCLLALTSSELYPDVFHFIWEIIQNNDDADYQVQQPQLRIVMTDDALYAWSNQVGFSKSDVDSICGAGRSSKKGKADTIGEKGIGFKSLFTVANRVTIHSEPYHFKFDTTTTLGNLGMVVPTWTEQSIEAMNQNLAIPTNGTTVILRFKPSTDKNLLRTKLEDLDFSFLIFCRRLKKIQISFKGKPADFSKFGELRDQLSDTVTLCVESSRHDRTKEYKFRLFSHELTGMPQQPERPQQRKSTVRLAFNLPEDEDYDSLDEKVYAFMPVKEYGFKFMVHANFILTANRGEVSPSHEWNIKLRSGLADLIHSAIVWFATSPDSPVIHQWLYYVESLYSVHDNFFKPLAFKVYERLKTTPLLATESCDTDFFQTPAYALSIPDEFRSDGKLILDGLEMAKRSIRRCYVRDQKARHALEKLGIKGFGHQDFLRELEKIVQSDETAFQSKPSQWHVSVATVLLAGTRQQRTGAFISRCQELHIVPLNSGEWTAPRAANLFLPGEEMQDVPSRLTIKVVEATACADRSRRLLFETLGIKTCTRQQICEAILADNRATAGKSDDSNESDSVQEIKFLFLSNYNPKFQDNYRFFYSANKFKDTEYSIQIPFGNIGSAIAKQLGTASTCLRWLNEDYKKAVGSEQLESFAAWLEGWSRLTLWPEVCRAHELTPVMSSLLNLEGSKAFLAHLRLRTMNGVPLPIKDEAWKRKVSNLEVSTDHGSRRLCETALPDIADLSGGMIPSLHLIEPIDRTWLFLGDFGVLTSVNARFLLQELRAIKSVGQVASINAKVSKIYFDLGKMNADEALISEAFKSDGLIYLGKSDWVKTSSCRWNAKYDCKRFPLLSKRYQNCSSLFKRILGLGTADLGDLIEEFQTWTIITSSGNVDLETATIIYQLLFDMNKMLLVKTATNAQVTEMKKLHMFPTMSTTSESGDILIHVQRSTDKFWIGDIPLLLKLFRGKVPLIYPIRETFIRDLSTVFKVLSMDNMKLTKCVSNEIASGGYPSVSDEPLTTLLQPKIPYIISVLQHVEETRDNQKHFVAQLEDLRVERVEGIKIRRYVTEGEKKLYGTDQEGEICLKVESCSLVIHADPELHEPDIFDSLAEHLSKYWNLRYENRQLIYKVLASTSPRRYIEVFQRAGITIPNMEDSGSDWIALKQKIQASSTRRITAYSNLESTASHSRPLENQHEIIEISDHEDDDDVMQVVSQVRGTDMKPAVSRVEPAPQNLWVDRTILAHATDDTAIYYNFQMKGNQNSARQPDRNADRSSMETHNTASTQRYNNFVPSNQDHGRTRGRASKSSTVVRSDTLQESSSQITPIASSQIMQNSTPPRSSQSQQPYQEHNVPGSQRKRRRLEKETSSGSQAEGVTHDIGRAGERLVYDFLSRTIGQSFSHLHWTSRNRDVFFPTEPFTGAEWDHSDFTYRDVDGKLGAYLVTSVPGYVAPSDPSEQPTYHLEVKTSLHGINVPAVLSNNQIQMARRFSQVSPSQDAVQQNDIYVLVRVYNLEKGDPPAPNIHFYPDPWSLICQGELAIEGDEGLYVRPMYL